MLPERPTLEELLPLLLLELVPLLLGRELEPLLTLLLFPVLPELDELPLLGRLTLPELLVLVLPELDELPLLGRFTLLEPLLELLSGRVVAPFWLLLVPLLFGRVVAPFPFRLLVGFGRTVAPLFEPLLAFVLPLFSPRELMLPGVLPELFGRTVACEFPFGRGLYPAP